MIIDGAAGCVRRPGAIVEVSDPHFREAKEPLIRNHWFVDQDCTELELQTAAVQGLACFDAHTNERLISTKVQRW